ncbi:hypothetical protein ACLG6S_17675 [Thermodesulfobacteriota bacterium B35]
MPSWQWLMDIYTDLGQDIGIQGDMPRQFKPWRSSIYFLARHDPSLRARWEKAFGLKGGRMVLVRLMAAASGFISRCSAISGLSKAAFSWCRPGSAETAWRRIRPWPG